MVKSKTTVLIIIVLFAVLLLAVLAAPHKQTDTINPKYGEKVEFTGTYIGITTWGDDDVLYYMPPTNYDILDVSGQYVFLEGDCNMHGLVGNEGKSVHVEGEFLDIEKVEQPFGNGVVEGYFFNATEIEVVG